MLLIRAPNGCLSCCLPHVAHYNMFAEPMESLCSVGSILEFVAAVLPQETGQRLGRHEKLRSSAFGSVSGQPEAGQVRQPVEVVK